jgi:hypothetical protein
MLARAIERLIRPQLTRMLVRVPEAPPPPVVTLVRYRK